jgi:glycosyltransferase involved in cell wall biosynthesis
LYPPVDILKFKPSASKTNSIISVGRFDNILNAKKQDVLIQAFIKLIRSKPNFNWKLIFLGGSQLAVDKNSYRAYLQKLAANYPIDFVVNPNFDLLRQYYGQAKIYWHAAGYDVDESLHPESTEHFGMSVVEAMASGAVPVVVNKGGLTEIVTHQQNGLLWQDPDELVEQTKDLIESPQKLNTLFLSSLNHSQKFSKENFQKKFISILES